MNQSQPQVFDISVAHSSQAPMNLAAFSHIVEQYASEGAFLWLLRNNATHSNLYGATDIANLDVRIHGNLEGLRAAGELAWDICRQQLEFEEPGEAFMAGVYALQSADPEKIQYVCEKVLATPAMRKGLVSALGWIDATTATYWIERFLSVSNAGYRYLGLAGCSVRRHDPRQRLNYLLADEKLSEQPLAYARALRLIGEIRRYDLVPALNQGMADADNGVRFWAFWSSILLGNHACINNLQPYVLEDNPWRMRALELVFDVLPVDEARQWISQLSSDLAQNRIVIMTTAILGDPHAIGWLIQQMQKPVYARLAGLAFNLITGIDLEQTGLHKMVAATVPDTDDNDFVDPAEEPDSDLPWPDPNKVADYWQQHRQTFKIGQSYFLGQPLSLACLQQVMQSGNQLQCGYAALKLALMDPDSELYNPAQSNMN